MRYLSHVRDLIEKRNLDRGPDEIVQKTIVTVQRSSLYSTCKYYFILKEIYVDTLKINR